jgi:hypothetical protein
MFSFQNKIHHHLCGGWFTVAQHHGHEHAGSIGLFSASQHANTPLSDLREGFPLSIRPDKNFLTPHLHKLRSQNYILSVS